MLGTGQRQLLLPHIKLGHVDGLKLHGTFVFQFKPFFAQFLCFFIGPIVKQLFHYFVEQFCVFGRQSGRPCRLRGG